MSSTRSSVNTVPTARSGLPLALTGDLSSGGGEKWADIPIPPPRPRVLAHMRDLVLATGSQTIPLHFGRDGRVGGFRLPRVGASVFGTACRAPLLSEEAETFRTISEDHVLVVRLDEDAPSGCGFTVDVLLSHAHLWLLRYRLWQHEKDRDFWLVPTQGEGRSFRISHGLLALSPRAPFFCPYERDYGFDLAAESLEARRGGC